ncbi:MAG: STAS domain-containing protein [Clostridiales bacterium]|jgi:anti-sigma B factor antagonist|nr:STAS domain-containing protein [Clostridiales bacterium]MBQ5423412.1 STAS domain-containing protein [Clostridiales bacterium]MBQ7627373.1 STAS domain-containing protein [Clostridiales bacterium]MBR6211249.1 STAS domain-containing protein [Clostridiales bacterium]
MLNITKNANGNALKIILEGRLDTTTAPQLEAQLQDALGSVTDLKFDLEKLEYISSAGLRVLLASQKIMNKQGTMVISNASAEVKEIFDVTGFSDILTIE